MSTPTKTKQLAVDTVLFGISTFGSKILVFLLTPLYTAVLSTEEYGVADLINTTVALIYPLLTLAISDATLRYALDKNSSKRAVIGNSILLTALSVLLLAALYPAVAVMNAEIAVQLKEYWIYFVLTYALYNVHLCFSNYVKGIGMTKLFAVQGIVHTLSVVAGNIWFLLVAKAGLRGYLLSVIIGYIVPILLMFVCAKLYKDLFPIKIDIPLFSKMLKYSIPMIPALLAWSINMYINKYMLIGMLDDGLAQSGIFSVANKIPSMLTAVLSIFTQAWQLSAISNVNDADESEYYTKVYKAMHIVALVGSLVIIPLSKPLSALLFDKDYYAAWQHIPFLTLSAFFSCLCGFLASAFRAYEKTVQLFVSVVAGAVINVILNLVLIPTVGVIGASIATAASFFMTWVVRMVTIRSMVKVKIRLWQTIVTYTAVIAACVMISFDLSFAYPAFAIAFALTVLLNLADIRDIIVAAWGTFVKIIGSLKKAGNKK